MQIWDVVRALVADGTTVLLTTQYLEEADQLAGRVAVVDHGRVVAEGTPAQLKAAVGPGTLRLRLDDAGQRRRAERVLHDALGLEIQPAADPRVVSAAVADPKRAAAAVARVSSEGIAIADFALGRPSLDEVFLALTGRVA
jgi:ABC-2 type transport system ATP-binding protein